MTRKRLNNYEGIYVRGEGYSSLYDCYKKFSVLKQLAFERCERIQKNMGNTSKGYILTANRMMFTYGFYAYTPKINYFVVITKTGIHMKVISEK